MKITYVQHIQSGDIMDYISMANSNGEYAYKMSSDDLVDDESGVSSDEYIEDIEQPESGRYNMFPIKYRDVYEIYLKQRSLRWEENEINSPLEQDVRDWRVLDEPTRRFISYILAFFAISDGVVNENIQEQIMTRIQPIEMKLVYNFQISMEDVHNITYCKFIEAYIDNREEQNRLFNSLANYPAIAAKVALIKSWLAPNEGKPPLLGKVLMAGIITEGIFFTASFGSVYYIYDVIKRLPGLYKGNEFISRDENMHVTYGIHLYKNYIKYKLSTRQVHKMMRDAVDVESIFLREALPEPLLGMNADMMITYVKYVTDQLLRQLDYDIIYDVDNPLPFMEKQSIGVRIGDFFHDKAITEYGIASAAADHNVNDNILTFDESVSNRIKL